MSLVCNALCLSRTRPGDAPLLVLDGVDARFPDGAVTLVSGATGVGKSTLLYLLAGLLRPTSGTVTDGAKPISRWTAAHRDQWRRAVGICFQELHLVPGLRVWENIVQPLIPRSLTWKQMMDAAGVASTRMDVGALLQAPVRTLSGGQQQRVAIARAMIHAPRILLLDEPTAFQDDAHTERLKEDLDAYASNGACVVICSHDPRLRADARYTPRYHLSNGKLEVRS